MGSVIAPAGSRLRALSQTPADGNEGFAFSGLPALAINLRGSTARPLAT